MFGIQELPLFIAAGLMLNITPGQDTVYVISRASTGGLPSGAAAALGIGAGCLLHVVTAVAGVSALLASSNTLFDLMKLTGALYLAWIGVGMLGTARQRLTERGPLAADRLPSPHTEDKPPSLQGRRVAPSADSFWPILRQGALTNALNPKVALFFLAFLPQFVSRDAAQPGLALAVLGAIFCLNATLWYLVVAWSAARITRNLPAHQPWAGWLEGLGGLLMLGLAARLALAGPA